MTVFIPPIKLSIAAPAYNEAAGIETIIRNWYKYLNQDKYIHSFEIVICNDGSKDNTGEILDNLAKEIPEVRPIHLLNNQGAAAALINAISNTRFEWILLMDSDDQFPIHNIHNMFLALEKSQTYVVHGIRDKKNHWFANLGSKMGGMICNILHRSKINDFNSAFKLVHGPLLRSLHLEAKGMNYSTEITSRLLENSIPFTQIAIEHQERKHGKSNIKFIRDSIHRLLFIMYIAQRQLLLKLNILRSTRYEK